MRYQISCLAVAAAVIAGTATANAELMTRVNPYYGYYDVVVEPEPLVAAPPAAVVAPPARTVETIETVRTVREAAPIVRRRVVRTYRAPAARVVTTRTIVRERIVPAAPAITEIVEAPVAPAYRRPIYDVVTAPAIAAPPLVAPVVETAPAYRYVYEPDRILVIDVATGIAVQAIPR